MTHTILVVDDDELIRNMVTHFLKREGYNPVAAPDGTAGIATFEEHHPALVVLDIAMPTVSGFDVARQIRAIEEREKLAHTPIILLTAYARSFFVAATNEADIDSYLTKPITPEKLLAHIQRFLDDTATETSPTE